MQHGSYLIAAASIGSGHMKAAEAIGLELKKSRPEAHVHIVDFTAREISWANWLMKGAYLRMLDFVPNLYEFFYRLSCGQSGGSKLQSLFALAMRHNMTKLAREYAPDAIICTHPFPEGAASWLKRDGQAKFSFSAVLTDYSVHQFWLCPNVDHYFVATEEMKQNLLQKGYEEGRIHVTGIPIHPRLSQPFSRQDCFARTGLSPKTPVVLFMGGGLGLGGMDFALHALDRLPLPMQFAVVAGRNKALAEKTRQFSAQASHPVKVWGYTDQVAELMAISSLLVSKPGALTISEAMAVRLPMLLHEPIPGPETENARYAARQGVALWVRSNEELPKAAESLLRCPGRLADMQKRAEQCRRPLAAKDILGVLEKRHGKK